MPDVEFKGLDDYEGFIRATIEPWSPARPNPALHTAQAESRSEPLTDGTTLPLAHLKKQLE